MNASVTYGTSGPREWLVTVYDWTYASTNAEDNAEDRSNNIVAELYSAGNLIHVFVGPDTDEYGEPYTKAWQTQTHEELKAERAPGTKVVFKAAFDKRGEPDVHCDVVISFVDPDNLPEPGCPLCDPSKWIDDQLGGGG